ncbi:MAG TPA: hypothetical protein PK765_03065 [bacterium]|nr:hypothetical protein [bacterium]
MTPQIELTLKNVEHDREVIERLAQANVDNKLDRYLNMYGKHPDAEGKIKLVVEQSEKGKFAASLRAAFPGENFYYSREDYTNLDDLVNHLFDHLKEDLSSRKVSSVHA